MALWTIKRCLSSCLEMVLRGSSRSYAKVAASSPSSFSHDGREKAKWGTETGAEPEDDVAPSSGISRPLSEILKQLNKKVPDSFVRARVEDGFSTKYIPWHVVNRIMNLHATEWSGEVRSITYSVDGKSVSVVYRVTLYGTDAEVSYSPFDLYYVFDMQACPWYRDARESTGTASVDDTGHGDPVQKAEAMAFRRACARLGLGLYLYHEDMM